MCIKMKGFPLTILVPYPSLGGVVNGVFDSDG